MTGEVTVYYILASSVVFYYDFALTMPQEIKHIWSSKLKVVNVLIIALRYITALGYVPVLVVTFVPVINSGTGETCGRMGRLPGILGVICQGITSAFLILRLFAIYDKRQCIHVALPFGLLNIVLSRLAIWKSQLWMISFLREVCERFVCLRFLFWTVQFNFFDNARPRSNAHSFPLI